MAKIIAEFDTVEKTFTATIDGKAVANPSEVYFAKRYSYDGEEKDEYACSVTTLAEDKENKTYQMTRLVAAESEGADPDADESAEFPGFLLVACASKAEADIANFFAE